MILPLIIKSICSCVIHCSYNTADVAMKCFGLMRTHNGKVSSTTHQAIVVLLWCFGMSAGSAITSCEVLWHFCIYLLDVTKVKICVCTLGVKFVLFAIHIRITWFSDFTCTHTTELNLEVNILWILSETHRIYIEASLKHVYTPTSISCGFTTLTAGLWFLPQGVTIPSQQRYVHYVEKILSSPDLTFSSKSLRLLSKVVMHTVPNFDTAGGCSESDSYNSTVLVDNYEMFIVLV